MPLTELNTVNLKQIQVQQTAKFLMLIQPSWLQCLACRTANDQIGKIGGRQDMWFHGAFASQVTVHTLCQACKPAFAELAPVVANCTGCPHSSAPDAAENLLHL